MIRLNEAGFEVESIRVVTGHHERVCLDAVVDGRRCAIKVCMRRASSERELAALCACSESQLSVPPVVWEQMGVESILVLGWIDGDELDGASGGWHAAGAALRSIHRTTPPRGLTPFSYGAAVESWHEFLVQLVADETVKLGAIDVLGERELRRWSGALRTHVESMTEPSNCFIHGDLQTDHVLLAPSGPAVIDWGDAAVGDPLWDLMVLTLDHPDQLGVLLDGYQADDQLRTHVGEQIDAYRALRTFGEISWLVAHGFDPTRSVERLRSLEVG